ncbi:MAG: hypothetical protein AVO39_04090 [delta proteobacterium MLS_D]|nr:MAG: hypothetical protein AVO39_04090 [delta proteobacterium MLS_D]
MKSFFLPSSIAVIGASDRDNSLGSQMITNLLYGYRGNLYPVNPNYKEIRGLPCFPSVDAIPGIVDLAIIIVPAPAVPDALEDCARKGVRRVMIQSAGFAEVGQAGAELQEKCSSTARAGGIRVWGPNCMGLVDIPRGHLFTFMHPKVYEDGLIPGRISIIVQSGMLSAGFLADLMSERSIGVGKACSIGNKSDVDECDVLEYLLDDDETDAVAMYLESIPRGRRFVELARTSTKPLVVLKGGKSGAGAKAALSHTSSLAGDARLQNSLLEGAGVTLAHDFQQMMELARDLSLISHTPPKCRTAIVTFSGGAGILSCDLLEEAGLRVAEFSEETKARLGKAFPDWLPAANPVDLFPAFALRGPLAAYRSAVDAVLADPGVDVVFMHYFAGLYRNFDGMREMKEAADRAGKILIMWVIGRREGTRIFREEARKNGIPVHCELSRAVECLAAAAGREQRTFSSVDSEPSVPPTAVDQASRILEAGVGTRIRDEYKSKKLLTCFDIPVVDEQTAETADEASSVAENMGYPLALKGLVPGMVHKTESGLVHLNIGSTEAFNEALAAIAERMGGKGRFLIQRYRAGDYELIAGFLRDAQFGPCVMFGIGGIFSELQQDVVFACAPLSVEEARLMIGRVRNVRLLRGFRGTVPLDEEEAARVLVALGDLGTLFPEIEQIDINPLVVKDGSPVAVDASVILGS